MPIIFNKEKKQIHLQNEFLSYIMEITEDNYLLHVYYGEKIEEMLQTKVFPRVGRSSFSPNPYELSNSGFSLDNIMQEMPGYDAGDYREGAAEITYADGTKATSFKYVSHHIFSGKKKLEGLPATYVENDSEAETIEIVMEDSYRSIRAVLSYTIFETLSVITKSISYSNFGAETIILNKALSANLDLSDSDYDLIQLPGAWANEKQYKRAPLTQGIHTLDSKRGASGVAQQPFIALVDPNTTENTGEVRAFHLVYSGNFEINVEVDNFEQTRVLIGINRFNFSWQLEPEATFNTPEVVMVYSNQGINGMSQHFHQLYRDNLARGLHKNQERPVLINNWESTYFDFNQDKLLSIVNDASNLGVELFVLDDGWFGERHTDTTSLGDWFENKNKLPNGLEGLSREVKKKMKFGLWFEPEMISEESELYKKHPDWHIHVKNYPTSLGRNQLILDFSRKEVRDYIYDQLVNILDRVPIDYIKWDMNRNMTEVASVDRHPEQQMETSHRYILGLYEMLEKLTSRYPNILFENCSGGAGRFDPGMCYYMPQSWTSDNTDAIARLRIQYSTSLIFPPSMICCQLSVSPNHQIGRSTDLQTRALVAMSGSFGLMLDPKEIEEKELQQISIYTDWYKKNRRLIQFGEFYRLANPFETNYGGWMFIDKKKDNIILIMVQILSEASKPHKRVKLVGLDREAIYNVNDEFKASGSELMNHGLYLGHLLKGDFSSLKLELTKI